MFLGILIRPFRALIGAKSHRSYRDGSPINLKPHNRLRLHWERGNDGHPRGRWHRSSTNHASR